MDIPVVLNIKGLDQLTLNDKNADVMGVIID